MIILGFNPWDQKKIALEELERNGVTFPNIVDSSDAATKTCSQDYRSSGVPLSYIIDQNGIIVDAWYGYEKEHQRAREAIRKLGEP